MPADDELVVKVARADLIAQMGFQNSLARWHAPQRTDLRWKEMAAPSSDILIGKPDAIALNGDCRHRVHAPDGGTIHVMGDLASEMELGGHTEIVISGDVAAEARIFTAGICHVFVGGSFHGRLSSADSLALWVEGDFRGEVLTGSPSTRTWVRGDFNGVIRPSEKASLLWLWVDGFAHENVISRIIDCRYTQFQACVNRSSVPKGLYPREEEYSRLASERSYNRWCVCSDS